MSWQSSMQQMSSTPDLVCFIHISWILLAKWYLTTSDTVLRNGCYCGSVVCWCKKGPSGIICCTSAEWCSSRQPSGISYHCPAARGPREIVRGNCSMSSVIWSKPLCALGLPDFWRVMEGLCPCINLEVVFLKGGFSRLKMWILGPTTCAEAPVASQNWTSLWVWLVKHTGSSSTCARSKTTLKHIYYQVGLNLFDSWLNFCIMIVTYKWLN